MGIFDSKSKSKSEVIPYDPGQLQDMLSRLRTAGQTPMQFFPGQTYAEMDPRQTEALGMREQFAGGMGAGMVDPAMQAWQSTLTAPDVANNPYVQNMLEQQADIAGRSFRDAMPGMGAGAIGAGQFGGSRHGVVEANQDRNIREALAQSTAQTQLGAYQQGLEQQRYGLSAAPGMAQFGMMPADVLMGVGDVGRAEEQRGINEDMARFDFAQKEPWNRLQAQAGLFNPLSLPYAASRSESESQPSPFSIGTQIAGLGMGAMQMPGMPWAPEAGGGGSGMSAGVPGGYAQALSRNYGMPAANPWADMFGGRYS